MSEHGWTPIYELTVDQLLERIKAAQHRWDDEISPAPAG